jgi:hypothetical protein
MSILIEGRKRERVYASKRSQYNPVKKMKVRETVELFLQVLISCDRD